jgi:hypothetical protein
LGEVEADGEDEAGDGEGRLHALRARRAKRAARGDEESIGNDDSERARGVHGRDARTSVD